MGLFSDRGQRCCDLWLFDTEKIRSEISLSKIPFYLDSAEMDVVKMIFHVLFLVLETTEKR